MDEHKNTPEIQGAGEMELRDILLTPDSRSLTSRLSAKIKTGEIVPSTRFTIDLDLRLISDPNEVLRITRDIKSLVENRELRDKIDTIKVVIKKSQYEGEVVNAVSAFRSKCEFIDDNNK